MNSFVNKNPHFIKLVYKIFPLKISGCLFEKWTLLNAFQFPPNEPCDVDIERVSDSSFLSSLRLNSELLHCPKCLLTFFWGFPRNTFMFIFS